MASHIDQQRALELLRIPLGPPRVPTGSPRAPKISSGTHFRAPEVARMRPNFVQTCDNKLCCFRQQRALELLRIPLGPPGRPQGAPERPQYHQEHILKPQRWPEWGRILSKRVTINCVAFEKVFGLFFDHPKYSKWELFGYITCARHSSGRVSAWRKVITSSTGKTIWFSKHSCCEVTQNLYISGLEGS